MNKNKSLTIVIICLLCLAFYATLFTTIVSAEPAYNVTFSETGLTSGIGWSVTLDGTTLASTTSTIVFQGSVDGTHSYVINAPTGYDASITSDTLTVSGSDTQQSVTFTSQSYNWWMSGNGVTHNGYSTSPAPLTSNLLWQQEIGWGEPMGMGSSPAVVNGVMYISNGDSDNIDLVNATTGSSIATYNTGKYIDSSSPAVCNGIIYVGAGDGTVLAINASTGSSVWTYKTGGTVDSSPAVSNGVVYLGSDDSKVYAFDAANGTLLWSHTTGGYVTSSPAVAYDTVYIGSSDGYLYALDAASGTELWHYGVSGDSTTSPAIANGIVYASLYNGNGVGTTFALNATSGAEVWTTSIVTLGSVALAHGMVYLCGYDQNLYALNATTGSQIWSSAASDVTRGQPMVAGSMLYYTGYMELHAINAFTGQEIWNYPVDMFESEGTSPVIANGVLYVSSGWGEEYAFGSLTQHTLTMNTVGQGTVNPGNQTYTEGSYVDLEAIPASGWTFSGWSGDASGTANTSITIDSNKTVTATFTQDTYYTPTTFDVIFTQNGLDQGASWGVTFNGVTQTSTTDTITFAGYADGDYAYTLTAPDSYTTTDNSGTLTIAGSDVSKTIAFTQNSSNTTIIATETENNATYSVQIGGNVTAEQFSNMTITPNQDTMTTTVDFTLTGPAGTEGFCNLTLPRIAIPFGTNPVVYIDGIIAENQLCTQDGDNFYITYTTHFSTHQIDVLFTTENSINPMLWFPWIIGQPSVNSPNPTTTSTPTTSPSPTTTPTPTTSPTPTPTITLATIGQYVTVIAAIIVLGAVTIGLVQRRKHSTKAS